MSGHCYTDDVGEEKVVITTTVKAENARLLFFNRELMEENKKLKELNRMAVEVLKCIAGNEPSEVVYDEFAYKRLVESYKDIVSMVLAKAEGEGE